MTYSLLMDDGQIKAVDSLKNGSICVGKVGSGKSRVGIAYYFKRVKGKIPLNGVGEYKRPTRSIPLVIITTAAKRDMREWEKELEEFGLMDPESNISVTIDSWNNISKYKNSTGSFFIFDEQRAIGKGVWAKSFIQIARHNEWIMLTATPGDDWEAYIPVFLAHGWYTSRSAFLREHAVYAKGYGGYPKIKGWLGDEKLQKYRDELLVDIEYDPKAIVVETRIEADYDRVEYRSLYKDRWVAGDGKSSSGKPISTYSELLYLLRKNANGDPSRLVILKDIVEREKKVLVFYSFDYELENIKKFIGMAGDIAIAERNGHRHDDIPSGEKWVYLVQYSAGAEGWNCTSSDTIVFYSLPYSYSQMVQAAGRINRRNTPFKVLKYYKLTSKSPIDIEIERCLRNKKKFNEQHFKKLVNMSKIRK